MSMPAAAYPDILPAEDTATELEQLRAECERLQRDNLQLRSEVTRLERLRAVPHQARRRLPDDRSSKTAALVIGGRKFYATVGHYEDGTPGELFVHAGRGGESEKVPVEPGPLLDWGATMASIAMQYGAPLRVLLQKMRGTRFEPAGFTGDPLVPRATSPLDYLARKIGIVEGIDLETL